MAQLTMNKRIAIVEEMIKNGSIVKVKRILERSRGFRVSEVTIWKTFKKWKEYGSVQNQNKGKSGRKKTARTPQNIQRVRESIENNPNERIRPLAAKLQLKKSSLRTILVKDLKLFPYKDQITQQLYPGDSL